MNFEADKLDFSYELERQKWFNLLMVYHPDRGIPAYEEVLEKRGNGAFTTAEIIHLAATDPRLRQDVGKPRTAANSQNKQRIR